MIRVSPGHYRDTAQHKVFDVWRSYDRAGWHYQIHGGLWSQTYETKALAEAAARREIARDYVFIDKN